MATRIDIVEIGDELQQEVLYSWQFDGQSVTCTNATVFAQTEKDGIYGANETQFFPADGQAFMDALLVQFSGSRLRALEPIQI